MAQSHDEPDQDGFRRGEILQELEEWIETPMLLLSFLWLVLVLVELVWGAAEMLEVFGTAIWIVFILEFSLRVAVAPDKLGFVRNNWLTLISLIIPAFRILRAFRVVRLARAARGMRLVRVIGTANRGMKALRSSMRRRGLGYVLALSVLVTVLGAGGMLAFEPADESGGGFTGYIDALWWTAMLLTSIGSDYWPRSPEGRMLCFLLSLYGLAVFGYITASFASFFIGRDAEAADAELPGTADLAQIRAELQALRADLRPGDVPA